MHSVYIYVPDTMPCFLGNPEKTDTLLTHLFFKANKWENNGALQPQTNFICEKENKNYHAANMISTSYPLS